MAVPRRSTVRGRWLAATRKVRELRMVTSALLHTGHPVLAQIVPARFCNLSCAYCNEYDKVSEPVPLEEMVRRIDHLGRLGTAMIGISGGEPLTHPQLDDIIRRMRSTGAIAGMITNGYLLNVERIHDRLPDCRSDFLCVAAVALRVAVHHHLRSIGLVAAKAPHIIYLPCGERGRGERIGPP